MIKRYPFKSHAEFLSIRRKLQGKGDPNTFRIGASDVATIYSNGKKMGLNEYVSPTVFFYDCCEYRKKEDVHSLEMTRGHIQESVIYNQYWRHFNPEDPSKEAFLENWHGAKRIFRKATRASAIYVNDKLPWLFATPDYIIQKNEFTRRGPLELKSPSSRANDKYEAGIATQYIIQTHDQMLVLGYDYAELFAVTDATYPELYQFERNPGIEKNIIESTQDFHQRVLRGKKIVYSNMGAIEKEQALSELAPEDNGDKLYTDYLKEKHRPENAKATNLGDESQLRLVISYLKEKEKQATKAQAILKKENKIREWFHDGVGYIEWPEFNVKIGWIEKLNIPKKILQETSEKGFK